MEQSMYTKVKVNNEIELCEISNPDCRHMIEKALLHQHISYYIRWPKPSLFRRNKNTCIICVNDNFKDTAEDIVRNVCDEKGYPVKFLMRKSQNQYL